MQSALRLRVSVVSMHLDQLMMVIDDWFQKVTNGSCHAMYVQVFPPPSFMCLLCYIPAPPLLSMSISSCLAPPPPPLILCIILLLGDDHSSPFVGLDDLLWCVSKTLHVLQRSAYLGFAGSSGTSGGAGSHGDLLSGDLSALCLCAVMSAETQQNRVSKLTQSSCR